VKPRACSHQRFFRMPTISLLRLRVQNLQTRLKDIELQGERRHCKFQLVTFNYARFVTTAWQLGDATGRRLWTGGWHGLRQPQRELPIRTDVAINKVLQRRLIRAIGHDRRSSLF
jgi:hypothetical protein